MNPDDVLDGKYTIVRQLGQGGMGAVFEARHGGTGRRVAVKVIAEKVLRDEPDVVARFQREARAAGAIESQHVVHVLDSGFDAATGRPYLVMEYLEGADLADTVQRLGPLPPDLAVRIAAQACLGLSRAHEAGIVHRDIKSANVFLATRDEGEVVVKLLDFGIAKVRADAFATLDAGSLTQSRSLLGSPHYMSPEQARGRKDVDHRTDIWSLGVVLYQALTGATPFEDCKTIGDVIFAILSAEPGPVGETAPWVPAPIADVVHRALSRKPEDRFQSAAGMLAALRALLPAGQGFHESQIVARVSEKQEMTTLPLTDAPAASSVPPVASAPVEPVPALASFATGGGVEKLQQPQTQGRSVWPLAASALVLAVAGALGVRGLMHRASSSQEPGASSMPSATLAPSATPPVPSALHQEQSQPAASVETDRSDGGAPSVPPQASARPIAPSPTGRATPAKGPTAAQSASAAPGRPATTASTAKPPGVYENMY